MAPACVFFFGFFPLDQNLTSPPGRGGLNQTRLEVISALG